MAAGSISTSRVVGTARKLEKERENKTRGIWKSPFAFFFRALFLNSCFPHCLGAWNRLITRNTRKYSAREFCNHLKIDLRATPAHIQSAFCSHRLNSSFVPQKKRATRGKSRSKPFNIARSVGPSEFLTIERFLNTPIKFCI